MMQGFSSIDQKEILVVSSNDRPKHLANVLSPGGDDGFGPTGLGSMVKEQIL